MAIDQDYLTVDEKAEYAALRSVADAGRADVGRLKLKKGEE